MGSACLTALPGRTYPSGVSPASKVCEQCGRLNAADEQSCNRCGGRFPGKVESRVGDLARTVLGRDAPMVRFFVALCVVVFALTAFGGDEIRVLDSPLAYQSLRWGALHPMLVWNEPWRLVSAVFVHLGLLHLLMNMSALVSLGAGLERAFGSARLVITFVGTGIVGFVVSTAWGVFGFGPLAMTAGASGGLFGLVGFEVGYLYRSGDPRWKQALIRAVIGMVLIGLLMSVNNAAHAGGTLSGMVLGYLSYRERTWRKLELVWRALAAALVVLSIASIGLSYQSDTWRAVREAQRQNGSID